jgi:putative intracellular protease/amidase
LPKENIVPKVLFVLSSHQTLGTTGKPTGWYLPEAAHPHAVLARHDIEVRFASPAGGAPPMVGVDLGDPVQQAFLEMPSTAEGIRETLRIDEADPADYDAILLVGGHGTMWDFPDDAALSRLIVAIYERGGAVAAVCHGPAGLVNVTLADGTYLVAGRRVASFTDAEEEAVGLTDVVPFLLESTLTQRGAQHVGTDVFKPWVEVDGRLVTGQNPASAAPMAEALVAVLQAAATVT